MTNRLSYCTCYAYVALCFSLVLISISLLKHISPHNITETYLCRYAAIFMSVKTSIQSMGTKASATADEYSLAKKLMIIVATDFMCWVGFFTATHIVFRYLFCFCCVSVFVCNSCLFCIFYWSADSLVEQNHNIVLTSWAGFTRSTKVHV